MLPVEPEVSAKVWEYLSVTSILKLESRGVVQISGKDAKSLLQGLVTNDMDLLSNDNSLYAALLTPQGKFLFDMIISETAEGLFLDIEYARKQDLIRRLMMYRLRAEAEIADREDLSVWAATVSEDIENAVSDPRCAALGYRIIAKENPAPNATPLPFDEYEETRIQNGVPDSSHDMMVEKYFWLETDAERLNGVSFTKGCFVGQELTARMKHRMDLKKKLVPVLAEASITSEMGTPIKTADGKTAGTLHSSSGKYAMAYMRLEYLDQPLSCEGNEIKATTI